MIEFSEIMHSFTQNDITSVALGIFWKFSLLDSWRVLMNLGNVRSKIVTKNGLSSLDSQLQADNAYMCSLKLEIMFFRLLLHLQLYILLCKRDS